MGVLAGGELVAAQVILVLHLAVGEVGRERRRRDDELARGRLLGRVRHLLDGLSRHKVLPGGGR